MAVVLENSTSGDSAFATAHTVSFGFTATADRLLVAVFTSGSGARTIASIQSGWTLIHDNTGSTRSMSAGWAYKVAAGGETSFQFTWDAGAASSFAVLEYSGLATASVMDQAAENEAFNNTATKYVQTGTTATLSASDGYAVGLWVPDGNVWISGSPTITNGSTLLIEQTSASAAPIVVTGKQLSSTAGVVEELGYAAASNDQCWASVAVFKAGGSASPEATWTATGGSGTLSALAVSQPQATLAATGGSGTLSAAAAVYAAIVSEPLKDNAGNLLANTALDFVAIYNDTTGALVARVTGLSTDASGVFIAPHASLVAGTTYRVDWQTAGGQRRMPRKAAA